MYQKNCFASRTIFYHHTSHFFNKITIHSVGFCLFVCFLGTKNEIQHAVHCFGRSSSVVSLSCSQRGKFKSLSVWSNN